jgi:ABC-type multidrug transport system ATPase subunit
MCIRNTSITPREAWTLYEGVDPIPKMIALRGWADWGVDRCNNITRELGCPCLITYNVSQNVLPCNPGFKCVSLRGVQSWDAFSLGNVIYSVQATCERCGRYEICPRGTIISQTCSPGYDCNGDGFSSNPVNPGYWSDGFGGGKCGMHTLLNTTVTFSSKVFDSVRGGWAPLTGTFCPSGTISPFGLCPRGYYCPNETLALLCGKEMICKEGSIQPRKCSALAVCNGQTQVWHIGALLWALGVVGFCVIGLFIQFKLQNQISKPSDVKRRSSTGNEGVLTTAQYEKYRHYIKTFRSGGEAVRRPPALPKSFQQETNVTAESIIRSRQLTELTILGLEVKVDKRTILYPNSVTFQPCGVNAIMGASGCGKSTLLTALMGRVRQGQSGKLIMKTLSEVDDCESATTGCDVHTVDLGSGEVDIAVQQLRSFVPQDDIVCGELTVHENIAFSMLLNVHQTGNMHLSSTVDWVMEQLQISHIAHNIVGTIERRGISGGQRKRVSIGMGMACLPSLLLLDEPTSGLDATTSEALMNVFGNLTRTGITVVCVLHQPRYECWMLLDQVLLLSKYGTLFFGSPTLAILYFTRSLNLKVNINENPADAIMDIISTHEKDYVQTWADNGFIWCKDVSESHPYLHVALNQDVFFEATTKRSGEYNVLFHGLDMASDDAVVTPKDIRDFIKYKLGMRAGFSIQQLNLWFEYISERWGDKTGQVKFKDLALALQDNTLTVKLKGKYENIIDKVSLVNSVHQNSATSLKVIFLVRKFISNCKKKLNKNSQHPWVASQRSAKQLNSSHDKAFINEVCYFVLLLRALAKTHPHLGVSESTNKLCARIIPAATEGGRIPAITSSALRMLWYIWVLIRRKFLCIWRSAWSVQLIMPLIAAIIVGMIHGSSWRARDLPSNITMAASCLGVLSAVTHIRTFALDRLMMRRDEITFAYLIAYGTADLLWITIVLPLVFGIPYWLLVLPYSGWGMWWVTWIGVAWWTSGIVYIVGVLPLALHWLNIIAAFIAVIFGAFINGLNSNVPEWLNDLSYAKWATESILITEFQTGKVNIRIQDDPHYSISTVAGVLGRLGFCKSVIGKDINIYKLLQQLIESENPWNSCKTHIWVLFLIGTVGRIIAAILLLCIENSEHLKLWVETLRRLLYKKTAVKRTKRRRSVDTNDLLMSTYHLGKPIA